MIWWRPPASQLRVAGCPPHDSTGRTYERFRAHTCASSTGLHAATIHTQASKRVRRDQAEGDVRLPRTWGTNMQSHQE